MASLHTSTGLPIQMPMAVEAEQGLVGHLVTYPQTLEKLHFLRPEHFMEPFHGEIFAAIASRVERRQPVSEALLLADFGTHRKMHELAEQGRSYLTRLVETACTILPHDAEAMGRAIYEAACKRDLIALSVELTEKAQEPGAVTAAELLGTRWGEVERLAHSAAKRSGRALREAALDAIGNIGQKPRVISTGSRLMDDGMAGGIPIPGVTGIAGRQGMGKSTVLLTWALAAARQGYKVHYYGLEMGDIKIAERALAHAGGFNNNLFKYPDPTGSLRKRATAALELLPENIILEDRAGLTISELKAEWYDAARRGAQVMVLDYLQLVHPDKAGDQRALFLDNLGQWLHDFSKQTGCAVLVAAQMNRTGYLRESDGLLNATDLLFEVLKPEDGAQEDSGWGGNDKNGRTKPFKKFLHPKLGACELVWLRRIKGRDGGDDIGSEEDPRLIVHPHGPTIVEA